MTAPEPAAAPAAASAPGLRTLRSLIEERIATGRRFHLPEVVAIVVPICTDLAKRHAAGEELFVHASSIGAGPDGTPRYVPELGHARPSDPADKAAVAPEILAGSAPTPRSSVFALGAIVYEMLTLKHITPQMDPPSAVVPGLPAIVDTILAKALVTDLSQRPDDLAAFAQAIHHFAPASIAPPPEADEHAFEVDLDLRMSLIPEAAPAVVHVPKAPKTPNIGGGGDPFAAVVDKARVADANPLAASRSRTNEELSSLKARLEADPAPRWIIVKDKMDHGPFAGIELLQQIASDTFTSDDELVDTHLNSRTKIKDHPEFSRFAHHANLKRDNIKEAKAVVAAEKREKAAGASKAVIGVIAVAAVIAVAVLVAMKIKGAREEDERKRQESQSASLKGEGSVAAAQKAKPKPGLGGGGPGKGGNYAGGTDFESALKNSISDMEAENLSPAECGNPIGTGIAGACGLDGKAWVKVAIQNGRALGVTVTTDPDQPGVNTCIASSVRGLSWRSTGGVSTCTRTFKTK